MELNEILRPDAVVTLAPGLSKKRVLEMIGEVAARQCNQITAHAAFDAMLARERLGSTGIGNGIALPHGRMTDTDKVVAVVARLSQAIDFDAIDNQPVDLLFALLVPSDQCQAHLTTLAAIAKRLSDKETLKKLRSASDDNEVYRILVDAA
ncbi:PTS IIA-like nitrogen regulatory protein PtsN [Gallaecimonas xiamenensis]|uniref:PTS system nitrogen regulatory protein IIA(Ntr) n=1 Tax=Gallaecimonas xiamenensis 3-C-1 TaxID=745411 RepID=K2IMT3_9GAMM|nr:PTS IIA-like nitrogen regulatory protein PtsN [Gallaecimonas xiamenensis]EKE71491.1 PTS system nitrogen regulatory protein IIA(Ntr) [Gallaecimonas xiamenensis 3-C-1]